MQPNTSRRDAPGTLTISVEIELGWGVHDLSGSAAEHLSTDGSPERAHLRKLLRAADACGVPITFDVVGHLLLDDCDGSHSGPYEPGWFDADPGTDAAADPLYYAPEVAPAVLDAAVDHELCTHTFSHVLCGSVDRAVVDHELRRARALHDELDAGSASIVPPRHSRPPNDLLREHGVRAARYAVDTSGNGRLRRLRELTVGPHPLWEPAVVDGVLETYCTTYPSLTAASLPSGQSPAPAPFRSVPAAVRRRLHGRYLRRSTRRAIETGTPLHLWCHLYDLSNPHQWAVVAEYLEFLATVPEGDLRIRTMASLADEYLVADAVAAGASP
ncbi:hypothetical protein Hbl1158_05330 [Halobaculum sp. CBA1158]|uniref:hypothetical protein n=1 Tax=Halobaculum sp. CBA1158 TaxID=2904243 RepID=UPI001F46C138|nr:hypothetical protein [Halobaculum sp. CBA1158]UIP00781.1 hypothetical protein Hbl1158_05330 [Halobaculum sp. CBA1158]